MPSFIIYSFDLLDRDGFQPYMNRIGQLVEKHRGELLVSFPTIQLPMHRDVNGVIRFENEEDAVALEQEVQSAQWKDVFQRMTANGTAVLARGLERTL